MRINTNVAALNVLNTLSQSSAMFGKSVGRLSSGFRINSASDDAAGLGIANKLRSDVRSLQQAGRNAEQATSALQVAEGGVQTVGQILDRMKELATQGASDNTDQAGRDAIEAEINALSSEIDAIAATTEFSDASLLDGTYSASFLVRSSGDYTTNDLVAVTGADLNMQGTALGVSTAGTAGAVLGLTAGASTAAQYQAALTTIDTAITSVNDAFSAIGAAQNRIEYARQNTNTAAVNFAAAESVIRDVDMAQEVTKLTKFQILQQAGQAMLGQANAAPQGVLRLLG